MARPESIGVSWPCERFVPVFRTKENCMWPLSSTDMGSRTQDSGQLDRNLIFPEIQISNVADLGDDEYCLGSPRAVAEMGAVCCWSMRSLWSCGS